MSKLRPVMFSLTAEQVDALLRVPEEVHGYYSYVAEGDDTGLNLGLTEQLITDWSPSSFEDPVGMTVANGSFTPLKNTGVQVTVSMGFSNSDTKPADEVDACISFKANGIEIYSRKIVVPPATNPGGDGTTNKTVTFPITVTTENYFEIYMSAEDDGGEPEDVRLTDISVTVTPAFGTG